MDNEKTEIRSVFNIVSVAHRDVFQIKDCFTYHGLWEGHVSLSL